MLGNFVSNVYCMIGHAQLHRIVLRLRRSLRRGAREGGRMAPRNVVLPSARLTHNMPYKNSYGMAQSTGGQNQNLRMQILNTFFIWEKVKQSRLTLQSKDTNNSWIADPIFLYGTNLYYLHNFVFMQINYERLAAITLKPVQIFQLSVCQSSFHIWVHL